MIFRGLERCEILSLGRFKGTRSFSTTMEILFTNYGRNVDTLVYPKRLVREDLVSLRDGISVWSLRLY